MTTLNILSLTVCVSSFVYTCYILCSLTYFLSNHDNNKNFNIVSGMNLLNYTILKENTIHFLYLLKLQDILTFFNWFSITNNAWKSVFNQFYLFLDKNATESVLWSLLIDVSLLTIFILQHSFMTNNFVKQTFLKLNIEHLSRSVYNACSSASLHLLINKWQQTPTTALWKIDTSNDMIWMLFSGFHVFGWSIIYSGCIMMDIAELCGLKQMWYKVSGINGPLDAKSSELCRYMRHMRHPSFTGFLVILWIYPFMR